MNESPRPDFPDPGSTQTGTQTPSPTTLEESEWLEAEQWIWAQLRHTGVADFEKVSDTGVKLPVVQIRAEFITTLLLLEPYRSYHLPRGLQIIGASVTGSLALSHARSERVNDFETPGVMRLASKQV
jgi:hypothetical protein